MQNKNELSYDTSTYTLKSVKKENVLKVFKGIVHP